MEDRVLGLMDRYFKQYLGQIRICTELLTEEELSSPPARRHRKLSWWRNSKRWSASAVRWSWRCRRISSSRAGESRTWKRTCEEIIHAVAHMSYHTGQIVFIAKQLVGTRAEIEFYPQLRGT